MCLKTQEKTRPTQHVPWFPYRSAVTFKNALKEWDSNLFQIFSPVSWLVTRSLQQQSVSFWFVIYAAHIRGLMEHVSFTNLMYGCARKGNEMEWMGILGEGRSLRCIIADCHSVCTSNRHIFRWQQLGRLGFLLICFLACLLFNFINTDHFTSLADDSSSSRRFKALTTTNKPEKVIIMM